MNNTITVVQARTSSTRLRGKVLLPLGGVPLLIFMIRRLKRSIFAGKIVVATSTDKADDPIVKICDENDVTCFRGHPTDLLDRHYRCALYYDARFVIKIPSDCPLIDPAVVDRVITTFHTSDCDYASNLHPASYPDGQDVEVICVEALERAWRESSAKFEREHTTPFIWDHPKYFRIANHVWETGRDCSMTHRVTIDYPEDYAAIVSIHDALMGVNPLFGIDEITTVLDNRPDIMAINARYAGVNWYRLHLKDLKTVTQDQTKII
jgi:spore coat polysaccharide biosynthesis protein SpsF